LYSKIFYAAHSFSSWPASVKAEEEWLRFTEDEVVLKSLLSEPADFLLGGTG